MSDPLDTDSLDWLARHVAAEPFFLACRLAAHQQRYRLSDLDLAAELHCTAEALTMIRLCRAPRDGAEGVEDARCVAERFGCDPARLAAALGVRWG
jgi:hypothetical protein